MHPTDSDILTRGEMACPQSDVLLGILLRKSLEISSTQGMDGIRGIHGHRVFTQTPKWVRMSEVEFPASPGEFWPSHSHPPFGIAAAIRASRGVQSLRVSQAAFSLPVQRNTEIPASLSHGERSPARGRFQRVGESGAAALNAITGPIRPSKIEGNQPAGDSCWPEVE